VAQGANVRGAVLAGVDQVLGERTENAVAAGVELADPARVLADRLDDATGGRVDDGGDTAGLGIKGVARATRLLHRCPRKFVHNR